MNPAAPSKHEPLVFEEYFELGQKETLSPFITPESRHWSKNIYLRSSVAAAILLLCTFILSFFPETESFSHVLLVAVYFLAGIPSLIESIEDLLNFEINIDVLMTVAAFSSIFIGSGMEGGLLLVLFSLSGSMEDAVRTKAKGAISALHKLSPTTATIVRDDGTLIERSVKEISIGTPILIKSGQIVPLDGKVIDGASSVNLVHITGENFPITKQIGDEVPAGARNLEGALTMQVLRTSADSTMARIIQLVTQAQEARPRLQRWFDRVSTKYALTIIILSLFFALALPLFLTMPYFGVGGSVYRALTFLIAASPCALIIALPIAYLSAISACAKRGILLKGGIVLDALAGCRAMAFDKTGTLTTGDLTCSSLEAIPSATSDEMDQALAVAYALEKNAVHPIAKAVLAYAEANNVQAIRITNFKAIPGFGLEGVAAFPEGDTKVYIGQPDYILEKLPSGRKEALKLKMEEIREKGELLSVLLIADRVFTLRFRDTVRPKMRSTLDALKQNWKLILVMLTGDHENSARRIAEELGFETYRADLRPEDKLTYVSELAHKHGLVMVGDGINDAPALARATVGICMGKVGTTAAMDASDIVLLQDNIELTDWLVGKAVKTQNIVRQNLFIATLAIFVASIPAIAGMVPLWLAVILHEGGTVLVGLNALRLLRD
ncbi:MAG: putative cadmium-transporting ATPase [Chlamydiae bacterium]|nr:putative cadmium-transporting ATPase [Chlamydiota bacterium]